MGYFNMRISSFDASGSYSHEFIRNVYGEIGLRRFQTVEKNANLFAGTASHFDDLGFRSHGIGDIGGGLLKQMGLAPRPLYCFASEPSP